MGSFNTTCSVSRLPIGIGDEVKIFFLIKNPYSDNINCYINDNWNLFGIPLDATYDDYGSYALVENERNEQIWNAYAREFRERILEVEQGPNRFHDCPVSRDNITFSTIQNAIWEGRAQLVHKFLDDDPINLPIRIMAVHKSVYDSISQEFESWRGKIILEDKIQEIQNDFRFKYYLNSFEFLESFDAEDDKWYDENDELTEEGSKLLRLKHELEWTEKGMYNTPQIYESANISLNCNMGIYNLMEYTIPEYADFAPEFIQKYLFECNMSMLNIEHCPAVTSGQDYHFMKQIAFHENIIELAKKLHQEHDSWDD
ncbi:hypothetical protein DQT32_04785 [Salmonella enterica subsp. enterica serovar Braenderup]|nr:hypothetical protein [Salmonella enterica subsp. enterica serovar Braenderup]